MTSAFERFRHVVLDDPDLQAQLRIERDQTRFARAVAQAAAARGIELAAADVDDAIGAARRQWFERWIQ